MHFLPTQPARPTARAFLIGMLLAPLLLSTPPAAAQDPITVHLQGIIFRDVKYQTIGAPYVYVPAFFAYNDTTPFNYGVSGDVAILNSASVTVLAPDTATATPGPFQNTITFQSFTASVTMNATWTPPTEEEFFASCRVNSQGAMGVYGGEGEDNEPVPLQGGYVFPSNALAIDFDYATAPGFYKLSVEFVTNQNGGHISGWVDLYYSTEETPIQVDNLGDIVDGNFDPGAQTLREALQRAGNKTTPVTIPIRVGGTIEVASTLTLGANPNLITLVPQGGALTLDGQGTQQILSIPNNRSLSVTNMDFTGGHATSGGAISNAGTLEAARCKFSRNDASYDGGAIATQGSGVTKLRDCLFVANDAESLGVSQSGGALHIAEGGYVEATGCLIAYSDKAVYNGGICHLRHCTLYKGDGLFLGNNGSTSTFSHCLLAGSSFDSVNTDLDFVTGADFTSLGWNAIQKAPPVGPGFTPLPSDILNKDLHVTIQPGKVVLSAFSPCLNAGNPAFAPGTFNPPLNNDIFGAARVSGTIDIGATELEEDPTDILNLMLTAPTGDQNNNGTPDLIDGATGVNPNSDQTSAPPVSVQDFIELVGGGSSFGSFAGDEPSAPPPEPLVTIESRLDERITLATLTVETSTDLINWTARVTYTAQGTGLGYTRTAVNGFTFLEHEKSGHCWFIREQLPRPAEGRLYVRMAGTLVEPVFE